jgi:hypothetical protein
MIRSRFLLTVLLALAGYLLTSTVTFAQSSTTGEISGTVTDPSGAVVANAPVTLKSVEKGNTQTATTNAQGGYRFALLAPGKYLVSATVPGFKTITVEQTVSVGAVAITDLKMELGSTGVTVEVSGEAALLQTDSSEISTTMNTLAVESLPNPGNDLSFIAQTAPGSVMNTGGGYGNFSSFGISATSNLFTMNGMYDNDPFLNLNNSGATNLLLGNNEIQEASVTSNGYSGQFGGFAGATVNYVTKSGSNQWHGNAAYWWNGRVMNANNWFNNNTTPVTPRAFDNANQWATSFGGPIKKDKAFFFFNYEGLRVLIPVSQTVTYPSPAFQAATLANLALPGVGQSAQIPFYQQMFNLWNTAPNVGRATPVTSNNNGCTAGWTGPAITCANSYVATNSTLTHEYLLAGRFDFNLTNNDKLFIRLQEDKGLQATYTDPINTVFNTVSTQPEYQGQVSWTHSFGVKAVNNFVGSATYYSAIFGNANPAASQAAFPGSMLFLDGSFNNSSNGFSLGGIDFNFPQGRNVTQYQFVDDFSYSLGTKHTLKLGINFHRYLIGDHDFGAYTTGLLLPFDINTFYAGGPALLQQAFTKFSAVPIAIYGLGWYVQDEWRATPSLKLTFDLRMDHPSNPVCQTDCFARLATNFDSLNHSASIPYNEAIVTGQRQAISSFTNIIWQPRFGFAWTPPGMKNSTVLRGGFGLFGDTFPGQVSDLLAANPPNSNTFVEVGSALAPNVPGSVWTTTRNANAAFLSGFNSGGTLATIGVTPNVNSANTIKVPVYEEWNLDLQHSIGNNWSIDLNYVGNHGYHETVLNQAINAWCPPSSIGGPCTQPFSGLPNAQVPGSLSSVANGPVGGADGRFGIVNQVYSAAVSNYNGLTASVQHHFSHGLQLQANFSWSHALDEISNGGFNPFNYNTATSLLSPQNPNIADLRSNYGNADYDTRKYFSLSYVYQVPYKFGPKPLLQGWQLSGTFFTRSGMPYTVTDASASGTLGSYGFGQNFIALYAGYNGALQPSCGVGAASATPGGEKSSCLNAADFTPVLPNASEPTAGFTLGTQRRNQFYGPGYFDTDFTVMKFTSVPHWESAKLGLGVQFFNVLNHPNFDNPIRDISNTSQFGQITRTVNTPTSILGSFLGGDASPRLIQLTAKFNF